MTTTNARRLRVGLGLLLPVLPAAAQCEAANLTLPSALPFGAFGSAVAVSGDTAAIGAYQSGENAPLGGELYLYERDPSGWTGLGTLVPSEVTPTASFGGAIAIDDDRMVVGAPGHGGLVPLDLGAGAAFVFERTPGGWVETAKLTAGDGQKRWGFGAAVAVDGDRIVVGAPNAGIVADEFFGPGAAYVFEHSAATGWSQVAKLEAPDTLLKDAFGGAVAVVGESVFAGTRQYLAGPFGSGNTIPGSVHLFEKSAGWNQTQKLVASLGGPDDGFGSSLSVDGDTLLVGAPYPVAGTALFGRAHVFERQGALWTETHLLAGGVVDEDYFGRAVALSGDRALVAAPHAGPTGDPYPGPGALYGFERSGSGWSATGRLTPTNADLENGYADSVALDGDTGAVGTFDDAWIVSASGAACPALFGSPEHIWTGAAGVHHLRLRAGPAHAGRPYLLLGSMSGTSPGIPIDGHLLPLVPDDWLIYTLENANGPVLESSFGTLDAAGEATARIHKPALFDTFNGTELHHAFVVFDLTGAVPVVGFASNAQLFRFIP